MENKIFSEEIMDKVKKDIRTLRGFKNLPHYAENLFKGVERAILENREIDISWNSLLFINRMLENRVQ